MKVQRSEIENTILILSNKHGTNKKLINQLINYLYIREDKMEDGRIAGILNTSIPINLAKDWELYYLAKGFNEFIKEDEKIKIDSYFTKIEIEKYKKMKLSHTPAKDFFKIVFHNVVRIKEGHYLCPQLTYREVAELLNHGVFFYNYKTQRQPIMKNVGEVLHKTPWINQESVVEMSKEMKTGKFHSNPISLNVRRISGKENIKFYPSYRRLEIKVDNIDNTFLDIIDGYHRTIAMNMAVMSNEKVSENTTMVNIFHYTEDMANSFIVQESKRNIIDPVHIKSIDTKNSWSETVKNINEYGSESTNFLFDKIYDSTEVTSIDKKISMYTFIQVLEINFLNAEDEAFRMQRFIRNAMTVVAMYCNEIFGVNKIFNLDKEGGIAFAVAIIGNVYREVGNADWQEHIEQFLRALKYKNNGLHTTEIHEFKKISKGRVNKNDMIQISKFAKQLYQKLM